MKISKQDAKDLLWGDSTDDYEFVESSEWEQDAKMQSCRVIFKTKNNDYYAYWVYRSGSPFTDWDYDLDYNKTIECQQVRQVEVVKTDWVPV
jgi:hypothetical protein